MAQPKITLADVLSDLLVRARRNVGFPQRATVGGQKADGGLRIDVQVLEYESGEKETFVQISRRGPYPADQEWVTVFGHWPERRAAPAFRKFLGPDGRRYLKGSYLTAKEPEQGELFLNTKEHEEEPRSNA